MDTYNSSTLPTVSSTLRLGYPTFRPENYGAACDGTTDDSNAWIALMADLSAKNYGTVELPASTTLCRPGVISLPPTAAIVGKGLASRIKQTAVYVTSSFLIDLSGDYNTPQNPNGYHTLRDFALHGGDQAGGSHLIRMYYNAHSVLKNLWGANCSAGFIDAVQLWDTRISDIQTEFCGTDEFSVAIWLRNSGASSGFGYSSDTNNQNFIDNVRVEDTWGTALRIERGPNNNYPPNGIYISKFKAETNFARSQPSIVIGAGVTECTLDDVYISINHRWSGAGTTNPIDGILNQGTGQNVLSKIRIAQGDAGLVGSPIRHSAGAVDHYSDISYTSGNGAPADNCILNIVGGVQPTLSGFIASYPLIPAVKGGCPLVTAPAGAQSTTNISLLGSDTTLRVDASNGAVTVTLPSVAVCMCRPLTIIRVDGSEYVVTLAAAANEAINGTSAITLEGALSSYVILPADDGWHILATSGATPINSRLEVRQFGSAGQPQFVIKSQDDPAKEMGVGYDTASDTGFLQSVHRGIAFTTLRLQPLGGNLNYTPPAAASDSDAASKGVGVGDVYQINGAWHTRIS